MSISCRRGPSAVLYSFGITSCSTCESGDVRQLGVTRALYHEGWCPKAPDNQGNPVHPTRRQTTCDEGPDGRKTWGSEIVACNGTIRFVNASRQYVCQRCYDRSTILSNLTVEARR